MNLYRLASALFAQRHGGWKPTVIRFGPLSGICFMFLAATSIVASLGIVAGSDEQATRKWKSPPSTYLAIFVAGANLSMRYAAIQGVVMAWWLRALDGSTLSKLHWDWRAGTTLRGAITSGRHTGWLGLACIVSTLVVIDGPLLQRSSTVVDTPRINDVVPLNVSMAPEAPTGLGGSLSRVDEDANYMHVMFNETVPSSDGHLPNNIIAYGGHSIKIAGLFQEQTPLRGVVKGCQGKCRLQLRGPAMFSRARRTEIIPLELQNHAEFAGVNNGTWAAPLNHVVFMVAPMPSVEGGRETVNLVTASATLDGACRGTLNLSACSLEAGIGEYDVTVENDEISLQSLRKPVFVAWANNTSIDLEHLSQSSGEGIPATLSNVMGDAWSGRNNQIALFYGMDPPMDWALGVGGVERYEKGNMHEQGGYCPSFRDPRDDIERSLNQLMLYAGAVAASEFEESYLQTRMDPDLKVNYGTSGYREGSHSVFHTDYSWFIAAAIVELVCIAIILPTYWGWWRIGRSVSFSPLELAKAFQAPLLADCASNSTGRELANVSGNSTVRYGVQKTDDGSHEEFKFAFGLSEKVTTLSNDMPFDKEANVRIDVMEVRRYG